jgi:hypothetical protein
MPSKEAWLDLLRRIGVTEDQVRDQRYDLVIHMKTAAHGAEKYYSLENNGSRTEGVRLARNLDDRVSGAWTGHPHLAIIDNNSANFSDKLNRAVHAALARLGLKDRRSVDAFSRKKILLESTGLPELPSDMTSRDFKVEHVFLKSTDPNVQTRIRKRSANGHDLFTLTTRKWTVGHEVIESRRNIGRREYDSLLTQSDPQRTKVTKERRCFVWNDKYYQADLFKSPRPGLVLMEAYIPNSLLTDPLFTLKQVLPAFITTDYVDVTENKNYSLYNLALK